MQPVIELEGLEVHLGGRPILKKLSCRLAGRSIGLLGPNGAGKSTLINTLLGFHKPVSGTARVLGHDVRTATRAVRSLVGYMPESDSFIASMTGVEFVRLMGEMSGLPAEAALERAHEAFVWAGLGEARYRKIGTYSLGMKQMAKLAQAIAHGPRLVILDEPTNGLDPPARAHMVELIREIRDRGDVHLIVSSHLLGDVEECCDEVLILRNGAIASVCNLEEERRSNKRFLEIEVRGEVQVFAGEAAALGCEAALGKHGRMKLVLPDGVEVKDLYAIAARGAMQIRRLGHRRDSLEDIFLNAMEAAESSTNGKHTPEASRNGRL